MELTCLAPKIISLKFLKYSFFYAGIYCTTSPHMQRNKYSHEVNVFFYLKEEKFVSMVFKSVKLNSSDKFLMCHAS